QHAPQVPSPADRRQAVDRAIGNLDCLRFIAKRQDREHGPENLFARDAVSRRYVVEDNRPHVTASCNRVRCRAAVHEPGALTLTAFYVSHDLPLTPSTHIPTEP